MAAEQAETGTELSQQHRSVSEGFYSADAHVGADAAMRGGKGSRGIGLWSTDGARSGSFSLGRGFQEGMAALGNLFFQRSSSDVTGMPPDHHSLAPSTRSLPDASPHLVSKSLRRFSSAALQSAFESARFQVALVNKAKDLTVRKDYKVEIDPRHFPKEFQEEFGRVLDEPNFKKTAQAPPGDTGGVVPPEKVPRLTICILIVGTRGDVQPFIPIGQRLQEFGHRVRLASHANYRDFVMAEGLEFYPLGGDPKVLAEYMVKNKGFLPSGPTEVKLQRKQLKAIINSIWDACTAPDIESGGGPFVADAIISNPPAIGHIAAAEALQVPLHVFFTMPWTATSEFPHPLANISTHITGYENELSYAVVDSLMWLGMRDMVNSFRKKLKLKRIRLHQRPHYRIPYGYIWSPSLAPKPHDWGYLEDVVGFCFLDLATGYQADKELAEFLAAGEPPVFVGFGSLPVEDPKKLTQIIVDALEHTQQRGIIQKGWGGLGDMETPHPHVLVLGNCPHDWLFPRCKAVIHHGGAGTTAAGLKAGCPTTIVPFFGDQFFWGSRVHAAGVGSEPIPISSFNLDKLVTAINFMLSPEVRNTANILATKIGEENGVHNAVDAFHRHLPEGFEARMKATPWLGKTSNIAKDCWDCVF